MSHKTISTKWIPGQDLESKIREKNLEGVDRVGVVIWSNDDTDIKKIAKEVDKIEKELGIDIFISDTFEFRTAYM